jgi:hypothetical protein
MTLNGLGGAFKKNHFGEGVVNLILQGYSKLLASKVLFRFRGGLTKAI